MQRVDTSYAGFTRKGISSVLGAIIVLSIIFTLITSISVYYLPQLKRVAEFRHECKLIGEFLEISRYPNVSAVLQLGGGETLFNPYRVSSTVSTNVSGTVTLELFNGSSLIFKGVYRIFSVNLTVYNTRVEDVSLIMSEGGVLEFQNGGKVMLIPPNLSKVLRVRIGRSVRVTVYNFTSKPELISGNGFGYISVKAEKAFSLEFRNVTNLTVVVDDGVFQSYWDRYMPLPKTGSNSYSLTGRFDVTLNIYNVTVNLY